jgi:hypothetical protein
MLFPDFDAILDHMEPTLPLVLMGLAILSLVYSCYRRHTANDCTPHPCLRILDVITQVSMVLADLYTAYRYSRRIALVHFRLYVDRLSAEIEANRRFMALNQVRLDHVSSSESRNTLVQAQDKTQVGVHEMESYKQE